VILLLQQERPPKNFYEWGSPGFAKKLQSFSQSPWDPRQHRPSEEMGHETTAPPDVLSFPDWDFIGLCLLYKHPLLKSKYENTHLLSPDRRSDPCWEMGTWGVSGEGGRTGKRPVGTGKMRKLPICRGREPFMQSQPSGRIRRTEIHKFLPTSPRPAKESSRIFSSRAGSKKCGGGYSPFPSSVEKMPVDAVYYHQHTLSIGQPVMIGGDATNSSGTKTRFRETPKKTVPEGRRESQKETPRIKFPPTDKLSNPSFTSTFLTSYFSSLRELRGRFD